MYMSRFLTSACLWVSWAWHLQESTGPEYKITGKGTSQMHETPASNKQNVMHGKSLIHSLDLQRWFRRLRIQSRAALFLVWTAECIASPPAGHKTHQALLQPIWKHNMLNSSMRNIYTISASVKCLSAVKRERPPFGMQAGWGCLAQFSIPLLGIWVGMSRKEENTKK